MHAKIKVGAVSYLNTKPLVYRLEEIAPYADISYDLPSRLADQLASGELDVALIPSVEYFQDPNYEIVSNACIGCRGPVLSVKLLTRVPFDQIHPLAPWFWTTWWLRKTPNKAAGIGGNGCASPICCKPCRASPC